MSIFSRISKKRFIDRNRRRKNRRISKLNISQKLTLSEKEAVKRVWGKELRRSAFRCFEFYKGFGVFNPEMVPNDIYAEAERLLNPYWYSLFPQHKCCLKYFISAEHRPTTIVQNIDNHFLDREDNVITLAEAVSIAEQREEFMIKVAAGSGGGRGIRKVRKGDDVAAVFASYGKDFICQEVLREHPTLSRFNPECINTIRVLSMNINDRCDVLSAFVRMGGRGSIVDNLHSAKGGGCLVGIDSEGRLAPFGINKNYERVTISPMGESFEGLRVEHYDKVVEFVKECHQRNFPFANLIGWDVIMDCDAKPIVVEVNLDSADIAAHQVFNGPVFGERREEIMEYMRRNPQKVIRKL